MRRFIVAAFALAATGLAALSARADVTVGLITSMSGPISSIGVPYSKGIATGIAQIGEVGGQKIKLV
jgi:branched-chain amino acid transport system substrate-binding protein